MHHFIARIINGMISEVGWKILSSHDRIREWHRVPEWFRVLWNCPYQSY